MVLSFETPRKLKPSEEWYAYQPNMSDEDREKFRTKHIRGADERIEIRTSRFGAETVIIVYKNQKRKSTDYFSYDDHLSIRMSANSKLHFTFEDWTLMNQAIEEARSILRV